MAEGLLLKILAGAPVKVTSAGTDAPVGMPPTPYAVDAAAELGADIREHRARQLTSRMVREADLILVMERYHRDRIVAMMPEAGPKIELLGSYGGGPDQEIADPIGMSMEFYQETAGILADRIANVADSLRVRATRGAGDDAEQRRI
ncbi:MAG: low molecular weight protein arginine phosphatase [candidate division WOR-3 bacterium]|nr:MAG: low molecular weight protein arginine phosphatase [candidate division WOR-3 bacterium]